MIKNQQLLMSHAILTKIKLLNRSDFPVKQKLKKEEKLRFLRSQFIAIVHNYHSAQCQMSLYNKKENANYNSTFFSHHSADLSQIVSSH